MVKLMIKRQFDVHLMLIYMCVRRLESPVC